MLAIWTLLLYRVLGMMDIPDLKLEKTVWSLLNVDVDGEMGIHIAHLVLVALGNTRDQVVDDRLDCS
jgi:hypothetical protein